MFFFLNLYLLYWRYLNVYFDIICADVVYPPEEKLSLFTHCLAVCCQVMPCVLHSCSDE